jgi:hypothetical protein
MKLFKIFNNLLYLVPLCFARLNEPRNTSIENYLNSLSGLWAQAYSSRYVQESIQIDWSCVTQNITFQYPSSEKILCEVTAKSTIHHNRPTVTQLTESFNVNASDLNEIKLSSNKTSAIKPNSWIIKYVGRNEVNNKVDFIIVTNTDQISMFVLVKDYKNFTDDLKNVIIELLKSFDYTTYYKYPIETFDDSCLLAS